MKLRVLKNTLARRAVQGTPFEGLADQFVGPLVYGFSADPVSAAKVMSDFAKTNQKLVIKAGAMPITASLMLKVLSSWPLCRAEKNSWLS